MTVILELNSNLFEFARSTAGGAVMKINFTLIKKSVRCRSLTGYIRFSFSHKT